MFFLLNATTIIFWENKKNTETKTKTNIKDNTKNKNKNKAKQKQNKQINKRKREPTIDLVSCTLNSISTLVGTSAGY